MRWVRYVPISVDHPEPGAVNDEGPANVGFIEGESIISLRRGRGNSAL